MVFSSLIFLFLFLPVTLAIYHLLFLPVSLQHQKSEFWRHLANLFLLIASLAFYYYGEIWLVWIVIVSSLIDYGCGLAIARSQTGGLNQLIPGEKRKVAAKCFLILSIVSNLGFLCCFKYFNFGVDSFNRLIPESMNHLRLTDVIKITLPLGISFYTFQSMSYTIDVYRGHVRATRNLIDFMAYVTLFPQLVAGPIVRYQTVANQLIHRTIDTRLFVSGLQRFILGLGKKVIIANTVARTCEWIFTLPENELTFALAWAGLLCYALQIYFDFSGYSDMAIGLGRMFGFQFLENFNYPYIAQSIQDFWRRWHISLSTWFRDYLYIPLGGNRKGPYRTYFNLLTVFFLCGLWHGASWNFVIWGLYHGLFLILERCGLAGFLEKLPRVLRHIYTLLVVLGGWLLFKCETLTQTALFSKALLGLNDAKAPALYQDYFRTDWLIAFSLGILFSAPLVPWLNKQMDKLFQRFPVLIHPIGSAWYALLIFIYLLSAMFLAGGTFNPFIYFRF